MTRSVITSTVVVAVMTILTACSTATSAPDASQGVSRDDCLARFQGLPGDGPTTSVLVDSTGEAEPFRLPQDVAAELTDAAAQDGAISLLGIDGEPGRWVVQNGALMSEDVEDLGTVRAQNIAEQAGACVAALAKNALPTAAGSDILGALQVAANAVPQSARDDGSATLNLGSDGLANDGALDLRLTAIGDVDPQAIVDALQAAGQLPNLSGVRFRMFGVGGSRSGPFNQVASAWLVAVWQRLCQAGNAVECIVTPSAGVAESEEETAERPDLPDDPMVPVPEVTAVALDTESCQFTIPASLTFAANGAELLPGAADALRPVTDAMNAFPESTAGLVGHTASVGNDVALSEERANAVREILISGGIEPGRLVASGVGSTQPLVDDLDENGELIESAAAQNRVVQIVVSGTDGCGG